MYKVTFNHNYSETFEPETTLGDLQVYVADYGQITSIQRIEGEARTPREPRSFPVGKALPQGWDFV